MPPPVAGVPSPDGLPCADCGDTPFSFTRLGVRVPMVVVSPWAEKGRVVHVNQTADGVAQYEHSSLPATLAALMPNFGGPLTARDAWALPLQHLWEETPLVAPRTDCPVTLPDPPAQTPSQFGVPHDGSAPVSDLQYYVLLLAEGVAGTVAGAATTTTADAVVAELAAAGALGSGKEAGKRTMARMKALLAHRKPASPAAEHGSAPAWVQALSAPTTAGPEQLWVNYGATPDAVAIRWCTNVSSAQPVLVWGLSAGRLTNSAQGVTEQYKYPGSPGYTSPFIHTVNVTGLPTRTTIFYRVGDAATGVSDVYSFPSNPGVGASASFYPHTTAFLADVGESEAANTTVQRVLAAVQSAGISSAVINGDISYASGCESHGCVTWDAWGRLAEPLARSLPWQITLGNHEEIDSFDGVYAASSTYRYRGMPTGGRMVSLPCTCVPLRPRRRLSRALRLRPRAHATKTQPTPASPFAGQQDRPAVLQLGGWAGLLSVFQLLLLWPAAQQHHDAVGRQRAGRRQSHTHALDRRVPAR